MQITSTTDSSLLSSLQGKLSWPEAGGVDPEGMRGRDSLDLSALAGSLAKDHKAVAIMEFHYRSMHAIRTEFEGTEYSRTEIYAQTFDMTLTVAGDPEAAKGLLEKLKAEWTPDKVAERIANFAVTGFGLASMPSDRSAYRDLIGKAVESGYSQARSLLGSLSEDIAGSLEETMRKVRERLDAWVRGPEVLTDPAIPAAAL